MGGFSKAFEHLATSEDADSLSYLTSVRNLFALLNLLDIHEAPGNWINNTWRPPIRNWRKWQ